MTSTATRRALQPLWNALDDVHAELEAGVVLAVSGGNDSRALLESVARWPRKPARVLVVAVDHGRRPAAAAEVRAVVERAEALGLVGLGRKVSVPAGDEATLRRARHAVLREEARAHGFAAIAFAHHRGDVAEGLLLHLAGLGGGRGGGAPAVVRREGDGLRLVRPFLGLPRATLEAALRALGVTDVVVDEDDAAGRNARGWLRTAVLAPLGERRPRIEEALARHARLLREDDEALEALVPADDVVRADLPPALLRRWLRRRIAAAGRTDDPRTAAAAIDAVLRLCARAEEGSVDLRGCRAVIRRRHGRCEVAVTPGTPHDGAGTVGRAFRGNPGG